MHAHARERSERAITSPTLGHLAFACAPLCTDGLRRTLMDGSVVASQDAESASVPLAPMSGPSVLPQKRRVGGMSAVNESPADTSEAILQLSGVSKKIPRTVENEGASYIILHQATDAAQKRSTTWPVFQRYHLENAAGRWKDLLVLCLLCHRLGSHKLLLLSGVYITNATKHLRQMAARDTRTKMQLTLSREALHGSMNTTWGSRAYRNSERSGIDSFLRPKTDRQSFHLE